MNQLHNTTKNHVIATEVIVAKSFLERGRGLLGKKSFPKKKALWIHRCRDIHTFFMKFPIDVIFVNKKLQVLSVRTNINPWRFAFNHKANSVFEFKAGSINKSLVEIGDQLNVGS